MDRVVVVLSASYLAPRSTPVNFAIHIQLFDDLVAATYEAFVTGQSRLLGSPSKAPMMGSLTSPSRANRNAGMNYSGLSNGNGSLTNNTNTNNSNNMDRNGVVCVPEDFSFHYDYVGVHMQVISHRTLQTFLNLSAKGELGPDQQQAPTLWVENAVLGLAPFQSGGVPVTVSGNPRREEDVTPAASATKAKSARPAGGRAKAAPPGGEGEPEGDSTPTPLANAAGFSSEEVPNHVRAQQLLASFAPPTPQLKPLVRAVILDGSASDLVEFDCYLPPSIAQLKQRIWDVLNAAIVDYARRTQPFDDPTPTAQSIQLSFQSFQTEFSPTMCDIDDDQDLKLVAKIGQQTMKTFQGAFEGGIDGLSSLLLFYVDVGLKEPSMEPTKSKVLPESEGMVLQHSPGKGLGFNAVHPVGGRRKKDPNSPQRPRMMVAADDDE